MQIAKNFELHVPAMRGVVGIHTVRDFAGIPDIVTNALGLSRKTPRECRVLGDADNGVARALLRSEAQRGAINKLHEIQYSAAPRWTCKCKSAHMMLDTRGKPTKGGQKQMRGGQKRSGRIIDRGSR